MKCINEMGDISGDINNVMRFRAVSRPKYSVPCSTSHYGNRLCHHDSSYGIISLSKSKEKTQVLCPSIEVDHVNKII